MLRELHIRNLAVIEDLTVELEEGLVCFTGETGAGKSLLLGALEVLLGLRRGRDMLRAGAEEGRVSALFDVRGEQMAASLAEALDRPVEAEQQMLLTRRISPQGRSRVRIDGEPATAAMARRAGELLVDIHGQHDHQQLLRPSAQRDVLDAFGDLEATRAAFTQAHEALLELQEEQAQHEAERERRRERLELYRFQAREIDEVEPDAGEVAELRARRDRLANLQRLRQGVEGVCAAMHEEEGAAGERVQRAARELRELADVDHELAPMAEQLEGAAAQIEQAAFDLRRYGERLELDPGELEQVEQRLSALERLAQKYATRAPEAESADDTEGAATDEASAIQRFRQWLDEQITALEQAEEEDEGLAERIQQAEQARQEKGLALRRARAEAAERLAPQITEGLQELGMPEAVFTAHVEQAHEIGRHGMDHVEMRIRPNPGQPERPLREIASGGELSRVMLALKAVLATSDRVSVLVFDEIDANVGGRMGNVIGRKLSAIADRGHQVLCITHLPQIAAHADQHLRIAKLVTGKGKNRQTRTEVKPLEKEQRVEELAEMLAGTEASETSRRQAQELLNGVANA